MRVKSLSRDNYYDRKMRPVGEVYEMDDREEANAIILEKLGKLEIMREKAAPPPKPAPEPRPAAQVVETKSDAPEEPAEAPESSSPGRRTYRRRDMRAQE